MWILTFSSHMRKYRVYAKLKFFNLQQIFTFWDPLSKKNHFYKLSVCLSVVIDLVVFNDELYKNLQTKPSDKRFERFLSEFEYI